MSAKPSRAWVAPVVEAVVALLSGVVFLAFCLHIRVDPMDRIGQVSGLASLQLRFIGFVIPVIIALVVLVRWRGGAHFTVASRFACAAIAGFTTAFVAGAIIVALRGTKWCLMGGDMDMFVMWANGISAKFPQHYPPPFYPPAFPHAFSWYVDAVGLPGYYAMKHVQIIGTALFGPIAYLAWRLLLRPGWALGIGVLAALVVLDPYKPHENLVLVALVPVLIKFLQVLRRAHERTPRRLAAYGVMFGLAFGLLFLTYSGWFRWSAPGALVAMALVIPWRHGKARAAIVGGVTLVVFGVVIWNYVHEINTYRTALVESGYSGPLLRDDYVFFDVAVDPTYFAMWKADLPGTTQLTQWPPPGELGGIGVYSVLLFTALGVAIAFARQRTVVIGLGCILVGVWLSRFWEASSVYATKLVQLYPRTSFELAHVFLLFAGFAAYYVVEYLVRRLDPENKSGPSRLLGAVCGLVFLFGSAASMIGDKYMPVDSLPRTPGWLAYHAHQKMIENVSPWPEKLP